MMLLSCFFMYLKPQSYCFIIFKILPYARILFNHETFQVSGKGNTFLISRDFCCL